MFDIYFDLSDMHQTVEETDDCVNEFYGADHQFDFDFDLPSEIPPDDDYAVIVKKYGCTCNKCGEIYPYAETPAQGQIFVCWSCRNF